MYYAVAKGHNIGIYTFWNDCKEQVLGYKGAIYKKFENERDAEDFILNVNSTSNPNFENIFANIYDKFDITETNYFVYSDGSCSNNGKTNAKIGIGIYFPNSQYKNVSVQINNYKNYTYNISNNSAELIAILETLNIIKDDLNNNKKITLFTDSDYCIKCATSYGEKCDKQNWTKDIVNKDLVKDLYIKYKSYNTFMLKYIKAHTNNKTSHYLGNKEADKLAYDSLMKE